MHTYDKEARLRAGEEIRRQIGEVDAEIERLAAYKKETQAAYDALATLEAVLCRMGMLAREAAKSNRRPGVLLEFEQCRQAAIELEKLAMIGGKSVLEENLQLDDMIELLKQSG